MNPEKGIYEILPYNIDNGDESYIKDTNIELTIYYNDKSIRRFIIEWSNPRCVVTLRK